MSGPPTVETLDEADLQESLAFYRDRFADADDFHVHLRRQPRSGRDAALCRALPGRSADNRQRRNVAGHRCPGPQGRRRGDGVEGNRAPQSDANRVYRLLSITRTRQRANWPPRDGDDTAIATPRPGPGGAWAAPTASVWEPVTPGAPRRPTDLDRSPSGPTPNEWTNSSGPSSTELKR